MVGEDADADRLAGGRKGRQRNRPSGGATASARVSLDDCERSPLAAEMGASLDVDSCALPVTLKDLSLQPALRQLALRLLRDFGNKRAAISEALRREDLTEEDLWKPGVSEALTSSSTEDEIRRYRLKLQFRADFLEAALEETLLELEGLSEARPLHANEPAVGDTADSPAPVQDH